MDHPWRHPPPPIQGNICPTCSISHFPNCPPHPAIFQPHPDPYLPPPPPPPPPSYDPYMGPTHPTNNLHRPFVDGFGDYHPHSNNNSPNFDRNSYGYMNYSTSSNDYGSNVGFKRMRVDESNASFLGNSTEVERRLKLIRDHGGVSSGGFCNIGSGEHGKIDELSFKQPKDYVNDFRDSSFNNFERKGSYLQARYNTEEQSVSVEGQPYMEKCNRNEDFYGQVENRINVSLLNNGHGDHPTRHFTDGEVAPQSYPEGFQYNLNSGDGYFKKGDMNRASLISQSVQPYSNFEAHNENGTIHKLQKITPPSSMSVKEPHYLYHEQNYKLDDQLPQLYKTQHSMEPKHDFPSPVQLGDTRQSIGVNVPSQDGIQRPIRYQNFPVVCQYGPRNPNNENGYFPHPSSTNVLNVQPPLPASPPPPLPAEPPRHILTESRASYSPPKTSSSLFPIAVGSSATIPSSYASAPETHLSAQLHYRSRHHQNASIEFSTEEFQPCRQASTNKYLGERQTFPERHLSIDTPKFIDASHIFKHPHRVNRPDHIVIILRGLPGSGKSYLAKMLRDLEVENGGKAPRIHSMDDYFMTEVEKAEESEVSKSSGFIRGKKPVMKKVMEYCYEPEMEEAYRSSMLKAFKKTLDEGGFAFVIVDDRNLRVADFAQFWSTAKRSGYEVYLLEAAYKDPAGCAARNVHGFTQDNIQKMARQWEEAPSLYLKLEMKSLLHGDDLQESGIQEVDMDMEDGDPSCGLSGSEERNSEVAESHVRDYEPDGPSKDDDNRCDAKENHPAEEVKDLGKSKWSDDLDEEDVQRTKAMKVNLSALSGLLQAYGKEGKSVHWGDQVGNSGFSIGAAKKANMSWLVIGPGSGYNLNSNPLPEEENLTSTQKTGEAKSRNIFQERLRAERESFRAVFDKRRHRIGGLNAKEEQL